MLPPSLLRFSVVSRLWMDYCRSRRRTVSRGKCLLHAHSSYVYFLPIPPNYPPCTFVFEPQVPRRQRFDDASCGCIFAIDRTLRFVSDKCTKKATCECRKATRLASSEDLDRLPGSRFVSEVQVFPKFKMRYCNLSLRQPPLCRTLGGEL